MKVLFLNMPWFVSDNGRLMKGVRAGSRWANTNPAVSRPGVYTFGPYVPTPFFLMYAASYVQKFTGAEVKMRDSIALHETYLQFYNWVIAQNADFIFIESTTPTWEHDVKLIRRIHELCPNAKLVVCGTIVTTRAKEIMETLPVVACIKGEYEKSSVRVVNGETGIFENDLLTQEEMNAAPFPMYDPSTAWRYFDACPSPAKTPHAHVWASRGCGFKCSHCEWPASMTGNDPDGTGRRFVRYYSQEYMEKFLREIIEKYRFQSIYFDDDTFNLNNKHTLRMCEVMNRIGIPWSAMCRADTIPLETWRVMRDSGCFGFKIGMESGSQRIVTRVINKQLDIADVENRILPYIKELGGMSVHTTWMLGHPGETPEEAEMTKAMIARFYEKGLHHTHQLSGCAELEGTPVHTVRDGPLAKYPDMKMDANYRHGTDGNAKIAQIRQNRASEEEPEVIGDTE